MIHTYGDSHFFPQKSLQNMSIQDSETQTMDERQINDLRNSV